ncbi:MAG: disulfide bond formation protein B [Acidimicrobiia bacterium]|nr:disulfide bond formation protein B [Acidimicrobiia bacterium]
METATTFFSLLALVANGGVILWVVAVAGGERTRQLRGSLEASVGPYALMLGLVVAAVATGGSLYYSESAGLIPCELCWYQRIAMYPLVAIFGVGLWKKESATWRFVLPLTLIGLGIAGYHYLIQRVPSLDAGTCSASVPCSSAYFFEFGFISMPYMAISAFAAIVALWWISLGSNRADSP